MSLVAELLSKVKPTGRKGDVPPNLKKVVADLSEKRATKKKIIIYSAFLILSVLGGLGAIYFVDTYLKDSAGPVTPARDIAKLKARAKQAALKKVQAAKDKVAQVVEEKGVQPARKKTQEVTEGRDAGKMLKDLETPADKSTVKKEAPQGKSKQATKEADKKTGDAAKKKPTKAGAVKKKEKKEEKIEVEEEVEEEREQPEPQRQERKQVVAVNTDLKLYMAKTYENKKNYSKAYDSYREILEVEPNNYLVMNNISSVLLHMGVFEESIQYAEMALAEKKDYVPSLTNLGIAYIKAGNLTAGEGYLLKVLSLRPSNKNALFNIALLYEKIGEYGKAFKSYQKLSRMRDFQGYLGLARISEKQKRISDAIMYYNQLIALEGIDLRIKRMAANRIRVLQ